MTEDTTNINTNTNVTPKSSSRPSLPWKTRLILSISSAVTDTSRRSNGTVNRRLLNLLDFQTPPTPNNPIDGVISSDITVDLTRKLWFRLFIPASSAATSLPVLIFFHGGGFTFLSPASKSYDAVCRNFATAIPAIVVSVNYRLSPEHRYPSQYDDAFDVLNFLDEQSNSNLLPENADLSRCFLAGDSAGANLAHNSAVRACQNKFRVLKVIGLIAIQPFFGGEERTESEIRLIGSPLVNLERTDWMWKAFLPDGSNRDHQASNVSGPNAIDISGLDVPSTVVFVGGFDPLQDWQRRYYHWLKKSGKEAQLVEYPNMIHAFYVFPELPESKQLIAQVKDFVATRSKN